jgi:hypothetical protein
MIDHASTLRLVCDLPKSEPRTVVERPGTCVQPNGTQSCCARTAIPPCTLVLPTSVGLVLATLGEMFSNLFGRETGFTPFRDTARL